VASWYAFTQSTLLGEPVSRSLAARPPSYVPAPIATHASAVVTVELLRVSDALTTSHATKSSVDRTPDIQNALGVLPSQSARRIAPRIPLTARRIRCGLVSQFVRGLLLGSAWSVTPNEYSYIRSSPAFLQVIFFILSCVTVPPSLLFLQRSVSVRPPHRRASLLQNHKLLDCSHCII